MLFDEILDAYMNWDTHISLQDNTTNVNRSVQNGVIWFIYRKTYHNFTTESITNVLKLHTFCIISEAIYT